MQVLKKITSILSVNLILILLFVSIANAFITRQDTTTKIAESQIQTTITPTIKPTSKSSRCIVSINGVKYDVTSLRKTHSGGDIFVCGTDMSKIFFTQHNKNFLSKKMAVYKVQ